MPSSSDFMMGASLAFELVATMSGTRSRSSSWRGEYGSMNPISPRPGAMPAMSFFFSRRTMGLRAESRSLRFDGRHPGVSPDRREVRGHESQGLHSAFLDPSQAPDGPGVQGVADQMEAADPLDGQDPALPDEARRFGDRLRRAPARRRVYQAQPRTADGAGDRLGMISPVEGVAVLAGAVRGTWGSRTWSSSSGHREGRGRWCSGGRSSYSW